MTRQAIQAKYRELMNGIAAALDKGLKPAGFVLLVFGEDKAGGRVNYISNRDRAEMLTAMKELLARFEGRYQEPPPGAPPS